MKLISEKINKRKFWIVATIVFALFVGLMAVFTFFDYQVVETLYNPNSLFGKFFKYAGAVPPMICGVCLIICLFYRKTKTGKKLLYILIIVVLSWVMEIVLVQLLKLFWGRARFTDTGSFTEWFIPNGITGFNSFPSGHVSSAAAILGLVLLCLCFDFKKWKKWAISLFAFAFVVCTALSRMVLGAHYPTDVLFSFFTSLAMYVIAVLITDKIYAKQRRVLPKQKA